MDTTLILKNNNKLHTNEKIKFIPVETIEFITVQLLNTYKRNNPTIIMPPIPVEEILEFHHNLTLNFDDLRSKYKDDDVLGVTDITTRQVFIDQTLDPHLHPDMIGRYRYTIAHEIGHWQLHRYYSLKKSNGKLPENTKLESSYISKLRESPRQIEKQADIFASCLLMPREMVINKWEELHGNLNPIFYEDFKDTPFRKRPTHRGGPVHIAIVLRNIVEPDHTYMFGEVAKKFAPIFQVSTEAMRIRLQNLNLLLDKRIIEN